LSPLRKKMIFITTIAIVTLVIKLKEMDFAKSCAYGSVEERRIADAFEPVRTVSLGPALFG